MSNEDESQSDLFSAVLQLAAERDGARNIKDLPGCWERQLADGWRVSINAHPTTTPNAYGRDVPSYHALFEHPDYVGALALVGPGGGVALGGSEPDILKAIQNAPALENQ